MNRKIRFRGKRCSDGKWVYGFYVESKYSWKGHKPHKSWIVSNAISNGGFFNILGRYAVKDNTIGQFTGLYDKNGKEIYEGDIVRYWQQDIRCINPDCDSFNWIYDSFIKKVEGVVFYEDDMFVCEDYTPLCWCGIQNLEELRNELNVTKEDGWMDCDGNVIDESVLGIEVIGNIHDNPELLKQ